MLTQRPLVIGILDSAKLKDICLAVRSFFEKDSEGKIIVSSINSDLHTDTRAYVSYYDEMKEKNMADIQSILDFGNNEEHVYLLLSDVGDPKFPYEIWAAIKLSLIHKDGTLLLEVIDYPSNELLYDYYEIYEPTYDIRALGERIYNIFVGRILNISREDDFQVDLTTKECCLSDCEMA
jgi:hypothetical protein